MGSRLGSALGAGLKSTMVEEEHLDKKDNRPHALVHQISDPEVFSCINFVKQINKAVVDVISIAAVSVEIECSVSLK